MFQTLFNALAGQPSEPGKWGAALALAAVLSACGGADTIDTAGTTATEKPAAAPAGTFEVSGAHFASAACSTESTAAKSCAFSGTRRVAYGVAGKFVVRTAVNGTGCSNAIFGDPAVGVRKSCYVEAIVPAYTTASWTPCANEGATCTFNGSKQVRYGVGSAYFVRTYSGGVTCSNATFGDPKVGVAKTCAIANADPVAVTAVAPVAPAPTNGTMTLAWIAPTTNADGSPLGDLAGYHILLGTTSGTYTRTITVAGPFALSYKIADLVPGTYFAVLKAYDASNNESAPSGEVSKTIK